VAASRRSADRAERRAGFTLLEVLIATAIMGIAVAGLLGNLSASVSNAARLTDSDRAALLARRKMDELLIEKRLPLIVEFAGPFAPELTGGRDSGWRARVLPFEYQGRPAPGQPMLEQIQLEVWWMKSGQRRVIQLEAFRIAQLTAEEVKGLPKPDTGAHP
jgi:general secretion pathway protein I